MYQIHLWRMLHGSPFDPLLLSFQIDMVMILLSINTMSPTMMCHSLHSQSIITPTWNDITAKISTIFAVIIETLSVRDNVSLSMTSIFIVLSSRILCPLLHLLGFSPFLLGCLLLVMCFHLSPFICLNPVCCSYV